MLSNITTVGCFSLLIGFAISLNYAQAESTRQFSEEDIIKCKYHETISLKVPEKCNDILNSSASRNLGTVAVVEAPGTQRMEVFFNLGSSGITSESQQELNLIASILNDPVNKSARYRIIGHTDVTGNWKHNNKLSKDRAYAVVSHLITKHGISKDKIMAEGKGSTQLFNPDHPEGAENRRVNIQIIQ